MHRLLASFFVLLPAALGSAAPSHRELAATAQAAYDRKDFPAARTAAAAALELRPDSPRYLALLAALAAQTGDPRGAVQYLQQAADLGVALPVAREPVFAPLQGTPPFREVLAKFAANREPRGEAEVVAELPGRTGIIEGLAFRPRTGDLFLSDVHHRCVWRRDRTGQVTRFTEEDEELLGLFGLALDEARGTLWAAMSAVPEMSGYTKEHQGAAALANFNLATGELRRVVHVPHDGRDHGLGDLLVADDGTVFATDAKAPVLWRLPPGAEDFELLAESPAFFSLQGLVLWRHEIIVADYVNGLFAVALAGGQIRAFAPLPGATLLGLDGLVAVPDGIVATQNGFEPQRVVKISLAPDAARVTQVTVLASGLAPLEDITLVTLVNDAPTVIAGAGWERYDPEKMSRPPAHPVRLLQVRLP